MPLLQLEDRIANNSDKQALKEVHDNRMVKHHDHKRSFQPCEYIEMVKNSQWCD
jgi:hypothetical protein